MEKLALLAAASSLLERIERIWVRIRNEPHVTGDAKRLKAKWWPDSLSLDDEHSTSGIKIRIATSFTLANDGPVDTSIKDIYMEIIHGRKNLCRLECHPADRIKGITIDRRRVWESDHVEFDGFIPEIDEPPKSLKCKFVVEAAGQGPFRKNLKLPAIVRMTK